ncbi:hypothetical protein CMI37_39280, partial [Candidatus Pacearchaeota archaeon]|nr:hypothetical protein [Candidatus Pacearchaeota archaeon]
MKYTKQGAQYMSNPLWAIVKLYRKKTGSFPWGFLTKVKNILSQMDLEYNVVNNITVITTKNVDFSQEKVLRGY